MATVYILCCWCACSDAEHCVENVKPFHDALSVCFLSFFPAVTQFDDMKKKYIEEYQNVCYSNVQSVLLLLEKRWHNVMLVGGR